MATSSVRTPRIRTDYVTPSANPARSGIAGARLGERDRPGVITVAVASRRRGVVRVLLRRSAAGQDFRFLGEPIVEAAQLLSCLEQHLPRLLLLDERLLDRLDHESSRTIHARFPGIRVLLLCDRECPALVEKVVQNHFHGLLTVGALSETFVKAIRTVDRGELWLPRALLAKAIFEPVHLDRDLDVLRDRSRSEPVKMLTRREAQVVDYLREGLTNKEIAVELGIMEDTVKKHLHNVFAKLGVHRRAHVILRPPGIV